MNKDEKEKLEKEIERLNAHIELLEQQISFLLDYMSSMNAEDTIEEIELKGELNDLITGNGKGYTM